MELFLLLLQVRLVALLDLAQRSLTRGRAHLRLLAPLRLDDVQSHADHRLVRRLAHLARLRRQH